MSIVNRVKTLYRGIPPWLLKLGGKAFYALPDSIRYGRAFSETISILKEIEGYSKDELDALINERFLATIRHAYNNVPFYKQSFDEHGVSLNRIKDVRDIVALPTMSKVDLQRYSNLLLDEKVKKRDLMYLTSSGTTGEPVGFYQEHDMTVIEWAYTNHIWSRAGYSLGSSRLVLRGKPIHPNPSVDYFYDPLRRELSCNIYKLDETTSELYFQAIERYKPDFIHGYMSSIVLLCKYLARRSKKLNHHFTAVLATSETVTDDQRKYVESLLGTRVFSFYGLSERTIIAGECEHSTDYHIEPYYGFAEIIDDTKTSKGYGELIGTSFYHRAMPLIRYRTGDLARWDSKSVCECGRNYLRVDRVYGRKSEMMVSKSGALVPITAINGIHSPEFDQIMRFKFVQERIGEVMMLIVASEELRDVGLNNIKQLLREASNDSLSFDVRLVDDIPLNPNGKFSSLDQRLVLDEKYEI